MLDGTFVRAGKKPKHKHTQVQNKTMQPTIGIIASHPIEQQ